MTTQTLFLITLTLVVLDLLVDKIIRWCKVQFYFHLQWRPGIALWFILGGWFWYSLRYHKRATDQLVSSLVEGHAQQTREIRDLNTRVSTLDSIIHAYTKALYGPRFEVGSLRNREVMLVALKQHEPLASQQLRSRLVHVENKFGQHISDYHSNMKIVKTRKGRRITSKTELPL